MIGHVTQVDWDNVIPKNIRFMRTRVWIELGAPLLAGCMMRRDDGVMAWVGFRYESVNKVCKRCGIIEHSAPYCPHSNPKIKRVINKQMEVI